MPLPRWKLKFRGESRGTSPAWAPRGEWRVGIQPSGRLVPGRADRWTARRAWWAGRQAQGNVKWRPKPPPRAGEAFPASPRRQPACSAPQPSEWRVRGACRRGCHGFRGSRGRARELPAAGRGRAGAGRRKGAAVAGAGGAGDAASPPGAALVQPPPSPPHGAAARWEPSAEAAGPSRPLGPSAPRPQSVEPSAPSYSLGGRRARGRSGEGARAAPRRPPHWRQDEHRDPGGTDGAAAGLHGGGAEAPACGPARVRAAALHAPAARE